MHPGIQLEHGRMPPQRWALSQVDLERKFGQKVKEHGNRAVAALHRDLLRNAEGDLSCAPMKVLERMLFPWGIFLDAHDMVVMLHRYGTPKGTARAAQKTSHAFLPTCAQLLLLSSF
jgi:hypothetical protein